MKDYTQQISESVDSADLHVDSSPRLDGKTLHRRSSLQECSNITCLNRTRWVYALVFASYLVNFGLEKSAGSVTELISSAKGEETN